MRKLRKSDGSRFIAFAGSAKFKRGAVNTAILVVLSVILAVVVRFATLSDDNVADAVLRGEPFLQIVVLSLIIGVIMSTLIAYTYYVKRDADRSVTAKLVPVLAVAVFITFTLALVFGATVSLYVSPLALCSLLVATLVDKRVGIVTNILLSQTFFLTYILVYGSEKAVESSAALVTSMVSSIFLIMFLDKAHNRIKFTVVGFIVGVCSAVIPMLINYLVDANDVSQILMSGLWSLVSIVLSVALFMIVLPLMEYLFRLNTPFRLAELCSLENPLLKRLAKEAPGTFNHSMVVGNLAELCADAIGENTQLAKVCAYYHDVGKIKNSQYFIENQKGYNPHDDVIPEVSVAMIISHVTEGYRMLKKERLPDEVADCAIQHHGTTPVNYFLYKAQNFTEENLDKKEFSYPGPKPRTKIAAIIMIADTVEAASRALSEKVNSPAAFRSLVHGMIKQKADLDQFTECPITYKDLDVIEDTLVQAIPSMYHARIQYNNNPKQDKNA